MRPFSLMLFAIFAASTSATAQGSIPTIPLTGQYNATPPTLTDGVKATPQLDLNGQLKVNAGSAGNSATTPLHDAISCGSGDVSSSNPCPISRPEAAPTSFAALATTGTLASVDATVAGYKEATISITSLSGTITFQSSMDGTTWGTETGCMRDDGFKNPSGQAGYAGNSWYCPIRKRFFQVALTTYGSGTPTGYVMYQTDAVPVIGSQPVSASSLGGAASTYVMVNVASTNAVAVSSGNHNVYAINCANTDTVAATVRLFDKSSAPTPGTDNPKWQQTLIAGGQFSLSFGDVGLSVNNGLGLDMTSGIALLDNTAMAAAAKATCTVTYN